MLNVNDIRAAVARHWWTVQRFGLSPAKLRSRLWGRADTRVLCNSIPKAGTHLLERALCLHPDLYRKFLPTLHSGNMARWKSLDSVLDKLRSGQILVSHLAYSADFDRALREREVPCLVLIRDPRDIVVSDTNYISASSGHEFHGLLNSLGTFQDRLRMMISGDPSAGLVSVRERLERFAGWLDTSCTIVRYEALVGPQGGGDTQRQLDTLREIFETLHLPMSAEDLRMLAAQVFSGSSPTFRRGVTGQWRQHFDPGITKLFNAEAGEMLQRYGYGDA